MAFTKVIQMVRRYQNYEFDEPSSLNRPSGSSVVLMLYISACRFMLVSLIQKFDLHEKVSQSGVTP